MSEYHTWSFPKVSGEVAANLLHGDKELVIVGVIGKSAFPDANKMLGLDVLDRQPILIEHEPKEGAIQFYYNAKDSMILLHFETTFDAACMQQMLEEQLLSGQNEPFLLFNQRIRNRFARMLLFASHVCHILVFVELSVVFDASLLAIFRGLKIIRDRYVLRFLPRLMKSTKGCAALGKYGRLCSPRMLFFFENFPDGYEKSKEAISKLEFEMEDNIYKMLRNESIVTNNSGMSLISIPGNKRFVYYNTDPNLREDPLLKSIDLLQSLIQKQTAKEDDDDDLEDLCPYKGFGKPLIWCNASAKKQSPEEIFLQNRKFMNLLKEHVEEAIHSGFDDNLTKHKGKTAFVILPVDVWYENFKALHKIFIENAYIEELEASDTDYKAYFENFDSIMDFDAEFFTACCDIGLQKAFAMYNNPALTHYSGHVHRKLIEEAITLYMKYARGPETGVNEAKLREMCESCWLSGKQQCEYPSLRGYPCMLPKHIVQDASEHSSGHVFVSTCNCGRTQGRREDPYTTRQANYEFYEYLANNCNLCAKVKKMHFAVFEPSINDYRAAEFDIAFPKLSLNVGTAATVAAVSDVEDDGSQPLTASQGMPTNLSLASSDHLRSEAVGDDEEEDDDDDDDDSLNEFVVQVRDKDSLEAEEEKERSIYRQPSTTEYLPGMVHTATPLGLLPMFPSWSLVCVGPGSIYSHNTGLLEHFQTGFLSGSNFLLPWDVHVRLEHSTSWAAAYEKTRYRKMGEVFVLKIFVGFEYECPRGHRFMMSSPDKVLRGGSGILRDSGSKVVYNNMPLYFPCPGHSSKADVAQLMRVHVVTPKAPVNVMLDPKVRTGERDFTLGLLSPPKLTQSAYWILRLPYIYHSDEGPIAPPGEVTAATSSSHGCLLAGMFGVSETELDD